MLFFYLFYSVPAFSAGAVELLEFHFFSPDSTPDEPRVNYYDFYPLTIKADGRTLTPVREKGGETVSNFANITIDSSRRVIIYKDTHDFGVVLKIENVKSAYDRSADVQVGLR